jgi:hypothetical protein
MNEIVATKDLAPKEVPARDPATSYEWRLIYDLERLLRYASTAKEIDIAPNILDSATKALQVAETMMKSGASITSEAHSDLLKSIDAISPKVYPVTTASLEISEIMEIGRTGLSNRQSEIRDRVQALTDQWMRLAVLSLFLVFVMTALSWRPRPVEPQAAPAASSVTMSAAARSQSLPATGHAVPHAAGQPAKAATSGGWSQLFDPVYVRIFVFSFATFVNPIILGFLGACAYILRTILQGLASQTFVLRDGTTYTLRSILGMILGFLIPNLLEGSNHAFDFLGAVAVPFLSGYAVEPMFGALDTIVTTMRDAVSRNPAPGAGKGK